MARILTQGPAASWVLESMIYTEAQRVAESAKEKEGRLLIRWSLVRFQPGEPLFYLSV
jgi:hypothetical protein